MPLTRRRFVGSTAAVTATLLLGRPGRTQQATPPPLFLSMEAAGAWDPTFLLDPVGGRADVTPWTEAQLLRAGNLTYAPLRLPGEGAVVDERYAFGGEDFFARFRDAITIFRGVDNQTVSHDFGPRVAFTGSDREGHPTLASLVARTAVDELTAPPPLAFITTGGYAETAGLVPTSRAGSPSTLLGATLPNSTRPASPATAQQFHTNATHANLRAYREARDARLRAGTTSPRLRAFLDDLAAARDAATTAAFDALAPAMVEAEAVAGPRGSLVPAAAAVLGAMAQGACVAAHLDVGGFDTHDDHDALDDGHRFALRRLLEGVDFVARQVETTPALSSRCVVVLVGSDFGRTFYNDTGATRGKDHWPVTAMMVLALGAAQATLGGNRVVGATVVGNGRGMTARRVRVRDGAVVSAPPDDAAALVLTPALIHQALHDKLHIDAALTGRFALPGLPATPLPFFG
ncbi:MAG: DUF1501 domain-containing protein [Deltaproteobacteria bacterium]|nr:DUF1501 domain-containing protein [Deltaproteobacteria bacterium]